MQKARIPQYLHMPLQLLWFDTEELMVIVVLYIFGLIFGGWAWVGLVIGPYFYIRVKRTKPRGFLRHLLYQGGLYKLEGYPGPHSTRFWE